MKIVKRAVTAEDIEKHPQITEWGVSVGQELEFEIDEDGPGGIPSDPGPKKPELEDGE